MSTFQDTMRAAVYAPPSEGLPYLATIFHTDGTVLISRAYQTAEEANQYVLDVSSTLVAAAANIAEPASDLEATEKSENGGIDAASPMK